MVVLSYLPSRVVVSQTVVAASQGWCFTSGSPHPIIRSVTNRRLSLRVVGRLLCYDVVCCLSPLLCQSNKWRAFRCHALNWLYNSLEPHGFEVRIQILDHSIIGHPGIGRFRSPDDGISVGAILWWCSGRGHHDDKETLIGGVPTDASPDLGVIIGWVLIRGHCRCRAARCSSRWMEDKYSDQDSLGYLGGTMVWPYIKIQTWVGTARCRWTSRKLWSLSINWR
jgi:hypothetical protein